MKLRSLRISNILSFKYHTDVADAETINFEEELNIIIGENGSGKSTALEVINFIFKRVLYKQFDVNQDLYSRRFAISIDEKKQTIAPKNAQTYSEFRLEPNWDTPSAAQVIRLEISLDAIDLQNIQHIQSNSTKLNSISSLYTGRGTISPTTPGTDYTFDITLDKTTNGFSVTVVSGSQDFGYEYLTDYNFYKELISFYNLENPEDTLTSLYEGYTLISSYRNYHAFEKSISLRDAHPTHQIQQIKTKDYSKSLNSSDQSEPSIFGLVRLRIAEKHFNLISEKFTEAECEEQANNLDFILSINKRLKIINLECKIRLIELRIWQYAFEFLDTRRGKVLSDINSLSAGQKAIIHLVFEAYGRGDLKGGVVIIDEPEIHLHYQFPNEYLQVIRELNKEQGCQYILVTHSEALINSTTINHVKRFSLNNTGNTEIKAPTISTEQRILIKILDNTRATYAFFAKKVLLVEGDSDRYFYKSIIQDKYPALDQQIAVLDIGGKGNYDEWSHLFEIFGLVVYRIADFDYVVQMFYSTEKGKSIKTSAEVSAFKIRNSDWEIKIDSEYPNKTYILKSGPLEHYIGVSHKGLTEIIKFCNDDLSTFLASTSDPRSIEIKEIMRQIIS